ncbi:MULTISPECIES: hypothetical protein [Caballeronia]|uniref:Uncharacterized protein n=1 Tax=Caballeronia zhejiangensis TaxID=871203 RepID=A0A656QQB8_9BURK|nr:MULTISPECIES: hypothetical protein [Caballeronia]KDR31604.1 hypothetical protein BG60_29415 [Caballeronia zhejiangensis]MCG7402554.1 hypothetical protein [Caballeronia zhejiangensis]MCI1044322.1 hypothetical protein [Caballeronia zhejiangensis]MDR5764623.1 hypothetical protein [Caballeronia sp. LZ028]
MTINKKQSSKAVTEIAEKTLHDPHASKIAKSFAGSVLAQRHTNKQTGAAMEHKASQALRSPKYSEETRRMAASLIAQSNKERKSK